MKTLYTLVCKQILLLMMMLVSMLSAQAQNVERVEYFIGADPGFGKGTSVPIMQSQNVTASFQINVNSLPKGFYNLVVRSYVSPYSVTENGKTVTKGGWSLSSRRQFFKETIDASSVANIVKGEYFADIDPGFGNGLNIPFSASQHLSNLGFAYDITGLAPGFHNVYVRFKDANGSWSLTSVRTFYKESLQQSSTTLPNIVQGEYFFDTDPGFGSGKSISITPGTNLQNVSFSTDVTNLDKGFHQLYVRFKDANGRWSLVNRRSFYKEAFPAAQPVPDIVSMEYYIDNDPGFNNGKKVAITAGANVETTFAVDMTDVSVGNHRIFVRAQDSKGNWSLVSNGSFKVEPPTDLFVTIGKIAASICAGSNLDIPFEVNAPFGSNNVFTAQLSDANGSFWNPVKIGTLTGKNSDTIKATIPSGTGVGAGYRIRIIASSPDDTSAVSAALAINRVPEQYFVINGKTSTCTGSQVYTASATQPNMKYTWELAGGGTLDTTGATATINWTTPGSYTIKLTPTNVCGNGTVHTLAVDVFNAAPTKAPVITQSGRTLYASAGTVADGVAAYQWLKEGVEINGATNSSYYAGTDGSYTVRYTNPCAKGPESAPVVVSTKKPQTITFDPIADFTFRDTSFVVKAVASSGLSLTYAVVSGSASIKGDTLTVTSAGSITVRATQAGNDTLATAFADITFKVNKATAAITLANLNQVYNGTAKVVTATTSPAGLPVTFTYEGSASAPVNAGVYEVIATVNNGRYTGTAKDTLRISKANQTITFAPVADRHYGNNTFNVTASATSGLPIVIGITSDPAGIASVNDKTITVTGLGKVFLTANQAGNQNYNIAPQVLDTFIVSKGTQSVNIDIIADKLFDEAPFKFGAAASTGLPLTYSIVTIPATGVASLAGDTITLLGGSGTVTITASQAGNEFYSPAQAQRSFKVLAGSPDLTVQNISADKTVIAAKDSVTVSWNVSNIGKAQSPENWSERIYVQSTTGLNRLLVKQVTFANTDMLAVNKTIPRSEKVAMPAQLNIGAQGVFSVELIPGSAVNEAPNTQANNTAVQQTAWTVKKQLSLELSTTEISEGSSTGISARVSRTGTISDPLTVNVAISNANEFSFPAMVTIPAGQAGTTFTITAPDNQVIEGTVADSVRVSATNFQSAKANISLLDNDKASLSITQLPAEAMEGQTVKFKVTTNLAPKQLLTVLLTSSNAARFPVSSSVTIPAGATSAEVSVTLDQDNIPEIDLGVNIIAGAANQNSATATILVKDDDLPSLELVLQTNVISEAAGFYATQATLRRASNSNPVAFTANLSASMPNTLILPSNISLAANESAKTFTIGVVDNTQVEGDRQVNITASLYVNSCGCSVPSGASSGSVSVPITVTDNDGAALQITATQLTLPEGVANAASIRISRNTSTKDALSINLTSSNTDEATVPATAVIPAGQAYVDVPVTTINDGVTDGNQQVYFQATAKGFSTGSIWIIVSDQNKPDFQLPIVTLPGNSVQAMSIFNYQLTVKNTGFATAPAGALVRGYLSRDNVIDNSDTLISEDVISDPIPAGGSKQVLNAVKMPDLPGQYKLLYWVNPDLKLTELLTSNNTSRPVDLTIKPDYTATAQVDQDYFKKGSSVPVKGAAVRSDGTAAINQKVEVYTITNGLRRTVSATTDASGKYTTEFIPLANEAGHYSIGASFPGIGATTEQDNFDILGVRINDGNIPQFKVILKDTLKGTINIQNLSNKALTGFSLIPVNLPGGATIKFDTVPVLAGNASIKLGYKVTGSTLSPANNYQVATLQVISKEASVQTADCFYYCQAPNAYVVADVTNIDVVESQSKAEQVVQIKLVNQGVGATGKVSVHLPQANWINSITPTTLASMVTNDTSIVLLKFLALPEVPFNYPIKGNIGIGSENGNSFNIPFTFEKKSESVGTVKVNVTDQFTYYSDGAPKVAGAHVVIRNYFTGAVYADGYTDATGVYTASGVPEGKHRISVDKEKHESYDNTITVNPGGSSEATVFLNYQAITFNWSVVPTAVQDEYNITLETKFETNVPIPVVTIDMPKTMPQLSGSETYAFNVTLTNHGLITAKDVGLNLPQTDPEYEFVTNYVPADLLAQQSIQVPVVMRRRSGATGGRVSNSLSIGAISQFLGMSQSQYRSMATQSLNCQDFTGVVYWYKCSISSGLWQKGGSLFSYSGRSCGNEGGGGSAGGGLDPKVIGAYAQAFPQCANCPPPSLFEGDKNWTYPYKTEKKSCVECINDLIGAAAGCGSGGASSAAGAASCIFGSVYSGGGIGGILQCIPLPVPPPIGCLQGILGALNTCANTQMGGESGAAVRGAATIAAASKQGLGDEFKQFGNDFQVIVDAYKAREDWAKEYYGEEMTKTDGMEDLALKMEPYLANFDSIRPAAQAKILAEMSGYEIKPAAIQAFFVRWNNSLYARSKGILQPNAEYPNIINWVKVKAYSDLMVQKSNVAKERGYASINDMYEKQYGAFNQVLDAQKNAVCASVEVQLSQKLTMTREAFEGTLDIFNGHPTDAMDSLSVDIKITDANGVPANDLFQIQTKSLINLSDVSGSGAIAAKQHGTVKFLFIPEVGAAPTASKVYSFGGSIRYFDPYAKKIITMPLSAIALTVNPSPNLMLHYFMERDILGDDALTSPDIEPSVPAELAVMVENQGYGPAVNMMISSAQPKIVENEKGLAINFQLIGSNFQGQPKQLGVTDINFGTVPPLQTRIGQWYFTSSLLGKFVSYDAKVVHANSFGNPDLSLVKGVKLHELTKSIHEYGANDDKINDFLVNDIFDVNDQPDIIYFSQGNRTSKVYRATSGNFSSAVMPPTFTNKLTVTASDTGWNYIKLNDPGNRQYDIVSVTRNDGRVIPLDNAWLTFVTLPATLPPVYENKFHFVDTFPSLEPVTYTVVWKPRNTSIPKVDSITGVPTDITSAQVQNLKVVFNKRIDPATFTYEDLNLTLQGGANIINSSVVITQIDSATFNVDLSKVTLGNGFYTFIVQAASVSDIYGINGAAGKQVTWTQFVGVPVVQEFKGIPESKIASSFDTIQVLFNLSIDETTVTPERFKIVKDGVVQPGTVTIDSVGADHKLFYLSGLKNILSQSGAYDLVVDVPHIKSTDNIAGVQTQSVTLTVDNAGPVVVNIAKSYAGGIDPQHVPYVNLKFNEDVYDFNTASVKLTRNGEVLYLNIDQLSNTDLKNCRVGNFGMLTYPDGNYTLTVDLSGLRDKIGNNGTGTAQVSWIVDHAAIVGITSLSITPDLGHSNTDGITSDQSFSVKFNLATNASQVTVSQTDLGGETVLAIVPDVIAGDVSIPVRLATGGNTGIKVVATGENGGVGTAQKTLFVDQIPLSAQWLIDQNQTLTRQPDSVQLSLSDKLLNDAGFIDAIQLRRNGTVVPATLTFKAVNDTLYEVSGLNKAAAEAGNYELTINLQRFVKYSSGKPANGPVTTTWTVASANRPPIAKAGSDTTVTKPGVVMLNGSASTDPDADAVTYHWVAPAGIVLSDSTNAKPTFAVTTANNGNTYSFLLIVSDGSAFNTDVVNVAVNITNQLYYRSVITGNWNNPATWEASADSVNWTAATVSPDYNAKHIIIQNGNTVTVTQNITIDETTVEAGGVLSVASGVTLTVINNGLIVRSNATGSGSIGTSAGTVSGDVTVERYVPARRAWRLLTVPFATSQTIRDAWQEAGASLGGYGTHITGGTANGFDLSPSNSSSLKWYNQSLSIWEAASSTLTSITAKPGYMVFVRGDRTVDLSKGAAAPATNTVLRATGTLLTGTQPAITVQAAGFTLIGNPYASSVDFSKLTKTNVPDRFYVWDPKRAGVGAYVLFDAADGYQPLLIGGSYTGANSVIESGQAFFVEGSSSAGSIVFAESSKSSVQNNAFRSAVNDAKIQVNLEGMNADNTATALDATVTRYSDDYSAAVTAEDAGKPDNIEENIAVVRDNKTLTVERRPAIKSADTVFLKIYNMKAKNYRFEVVPDKLDGTVSTAYLEDAWLNTRTALNVDKPTIIQFSITSDAASANPNRFRIVFKASETLPVNITSVKAYEKNAGIEVDWNVATETNIHHYEVEKSGNGQDFTKVGNVQATGNNNGAVSYNWFDKKPLDGNNFYRIRSVENTGNSKLSQVVLVKTGSDKNSIVVYPNPVTDKTLKLQLNNQPKGEYLLQLFNVAGQQVFGKTIVHEGGSATQTIPLGSIVSKGVYQLFITNGETKITQQLIVQ